VFDWEEKLAEIPSCPGVYLMKDRAGEIVYIGKSINLRSRVRSYAHGADARPFVARLGKILGDIETVITRSGKEALLLERNLIKQHQPRYNVMLRDDKAYLSLAIDTAARWPRVVAVRRQARKGVRYFGPYHCASAARRTLALLNRHFMLRTCPDSTLRNRARPCLQHQIKRCPAPCVLDIEHTQYMERVNEVILFLEGRTGELKAQLTERMNVASGCLEFELAARCRDQIRAIDNMMEPQAVDRVSALDRDAVGCFREGDRAVVQIMRLRRGKLESAQSFDFKDHEVPTEELLSTFLNLYYQSGVAIPHEVLVPIHLEDASAISEILTDLRGSRVAVLTPRRGHKRELVEGATRNAENQFARARNRGGHVTDMLEKLQVRLRLAHYPSRIECFDISNFQGSQIVGSMVVFDEGEPDRRSYRHFKIRSTKGQDDFASMYEVLSRRLRRTVDGDWPKPDLVVLDGGKGQLGQAIAVMSDLGVHDVDVVALAKGRVERDVRGAEVVKSPERVFLPGRKNPLILRQNSAELFLLARLRDEAHRFAVTFHRKLRKKATVRSVLDDIPGVGPKRRTALLRHFGGLARIRRATLEELTETTGINTPTAQAVYAFFLAEES
jgi:excinuclease ABC subunit C